MSRVHPDHHSLLKTLENLGALDPKWRGIKIECGTRFDGVQWVQVGEQPLIEMERPWRLDEVLLRVAQRRLAEQVREALEAEGLRIAKAELHRLWGWVA